MIYVENSGRLGNQLFRYAIARKMQIERGDWITYRFAPDMSLGTTTDWGNQLQHFHITSKITFDSSCEKYYKTKTTLKQKIILLPYLLIRNLICNCYPLLNFYQSVFMPFLNKNGLYIQSDGYIPLCHCNKEDVIINGLYEAPQYFDNIKDILLEEITPKLPPLEKNKTLYDAILNNQSVCISIRRGDFLSETFKSRFNVCSKGYFYAAIDKMKTLYPDCIFIFFSDDIKWCIDNFNFLNVNKYFESGDDPVWEKLRLMYSCKHFIISNSTFSWWAQYLSRNNQKTVIAPERWRNTKNFDSPLNEAFFIKLAVD